MRVRKPKRLLTAGLLALCTSAITAAAATYTLPQIMSAPFASGLIASPKGGTVAWLENRAGQRNIWIASGPGWQAKQITHFNTDDGQEIADLAWAPDGTYLLFARGGDFENGGENPNPDLSAQKPDQSIWRVDVAGGAPAKLVEGQAPAISSKGEIVFIRKGQVFELTGGREGSPLLEGKGTQSDLRWSPDGTRFAFVSSRQEHSFIGVFTLADKSIRYLDPSIDGDREPVWSPDGGSIAFVRVPFQRTAFFSAHRSGPPWSIRIAEVSTGRGREVFRAAEGQGSVFHEVVADGQIIWSGNRLIFPWERTGWVHLFSLPLSGGDAVELTPGEGEVEHVAPSHDCRTIYYSTNIGDIDRRHLADVAADGSAKPRALTNGTDIEWQPAPLADGSSLAFLSSSYNQSAHAAIQTSEGQRRRMSTPPPAEFPAASLVKPRQVLITAADGLQLHAQLFLPPSNAGSSQGARHPALVFFHGGSRRQMLLGFHYMYYYSNAYSLNQYLASLGYVVLSVNYRSGIGYGLDFREAVNYGARGGSEYNDVMGAGLYLKSRDDVDGRRIGVWGGSYGGYLTAMALARSSDLFAAGVDFHGVHDWSSLRGILSRADASGDPEQINETREAARIAFESSPMASVGTWKSPVLLIHGDDDRNVDFAQTPILAEALRRRGVPFEQLIFPNEIHDFLLHRHWLEAYEATADFFARKLTETTQSAARH